MKKILLRCILALLILLGLRLIYVNIFHVPFFEQVFVSTTIGYIIAQILAEVIFNKSKLSK